MKKSENKEKKYTGEQKKAVLTAVITAFITTFMGSALNLSIPAIGKEFGVSAQEVGWVVTVYMLSCAALAVSFGKAADRIDRSIILRIGILVFAGASATAVFSQAMWMLLLFRFVQGVGASMIFATNIAMLSAVFDEAERGKVLGYATCATYVGLSLGPVLGGILNGRFGWRSVFAAAAAVAAVAFLTAALNRSEKDRRKVLCSMRFDWQGSILFTAAISVTMYGISALKSVSYAAWITAGGLLLFVFFVRAEKRAEDPLIDIQVFRGNIAYTFANLAAMLSYGVIFAVSYLISVYLQLIKGFSSQTAGLVLLSSTAVIAVFSPVFGRIADKHSPQIMSAIGMGICTVALAGMIFITAEMKLSILILLLALSGFGFSIFSSPNTVAVMSSVKQEDYSSATAVLATMRSSGHTVSMAIVTLIMGIFMDGNTLSDAKPEIMIKTMQTGFAVFTIFCIFGIFMAFHRKT